MHEVVYKLINVVFVIVLFTGAISHLYCLLHFVLAIFNVILEGLVI